MTEQGSANHLEESNNNETVKTINIKGYCEHGRQKSRCKDCGGSGICEHRRQRRECKDCGGSGICEHRRLVIVSIVDKEENAKTAEVVVFVSIVD